SGAAPVELIGTQKPPRRGQRIARDVRAGRLLHGRRHGCTFSAHDCCRKSTAKTHKYVQKSEHRHATTSTKGGLKVDVNMDGDTAPEPPRSVSEPSVRACAMAVQIQRQTNCLNRCRAPEAVGISFALCVSGKVASNAVRARRDPLA